MAMVSTGFYLYVTLADAGANTSTMSFKLWDGAGAPADYTAATASATAILAALEPITDAAVKGYSVQERFADDAFALPGAGVNVEERASVVVQLATDPFKKSQMVIPAPSIGIFKGTSGDSLNDIDPTDTDLRAFVALANDAGAAKFTISDGEFVDASYANQGIVRGSRTHRRSSRG